MVNVQTVRSALHAVAHPDRVEQLQRFFKTGPGEYAEGDRLVGAYVPDCRRIARQFEGLPIPAVISLLTSAIHEERLIALLILVRQFARADVSEQESLYQFYLAHTAHINNWDLVDCSAEHIVGAWLADKDHSALLALSGSTSIWERRIAMMACFHGIKRGQFDAALAVANALIDDPHDLIHKAVGWMLREIGKRDLAAEEQFLERHARRMPRTMLRYAIERFPEKQRRKHLDAKRKQPRGIIF